MTINVKYKQTGTWPTLGEAVSSNERIFVFIRDSVGAIAEEDTEFVKEIKVKPGYDRDIDREEGAATIMTSYEARDVEGDCIYLVDVSKVYYDFDSTGSPKNFKNIANQVNG